MKGLLKYMRHNPLYIVAWAVILPFLIYVLWIGVWPLVWILGLAVVVLIYGARQNIKGRWK